MTIQSHTQVVYVPENSGLAGTILGTVFGVGMVACGLTFFAFAGAEVFIDFPDWVRQLSGLCFVLLGVGVLYAILNGAETELVISPDQGKLVMRQTARFTGSFEKDIFFYDIQEVELSKKVDAHADHPRDFSNYVLNVSVLYTDPKSGKPKREYVYIGPATKAEACEIEIRNAMNSRSGSQTQFNSSK